MISNELRLDGNVALITTCGVAWFSDLALSLAMGGAKIVITGGAERRVIEATLKVRKGGGEAFGIPADLTIKREIKKTTEETISRFGRIDILINCLNLQLWKPLLDLKEEEWCKVLDSNLTSTFFCMQAVGKYMVAQKKGSIINVISVLAERGLQNGTAYCASMGGILQLTRAAALEWAQHNVRVNAVGIGWMEERVSGGEKDLMTRYIPMRRRARPEDITSLVLLMASDASSYSSGSIYFVDGGLMARG
jgi:NAD(P)-dependent dehydrogenase (short-subunit alcohol dehydrogenase family)